MSVILITMPEARERSTVEHFALRTEVDEDDGLDFASGLAELGHQVYFVDWVDFGEGRSSRMFSYRDQRFVPPRPVETMDLIFAYNFKNHAANLDLFFRMLHCFETVPAIVVNEPLLIRHNLDKSYYWDLERASIRVIPNYEVSTRLRRQFEAGQRLVLKPRHGECGVGIHLVSSVKELGLVEGRESDYIAQHFMLEIRCGERSLVFLGREFSHAVLKMPAPGDPREFRCNESLGGTVHVYRPTTEEMDFALAVLDGYSSLGHVPHFSRVDLIDTETGPCLMEAELMNPSMFANYSGSGTRFGRAVASYLDGLLRMDGQRREQQI